MYINQLMIPNQNHFNLDLIDEGIKQCAVIRIFGVLIAHNNQISMIN